MIGADIRRDPSLNSSYGIKPLGKLQPLLKSLSKIFGHTDKTVRAEVRVRRDG